MIRVKKEELANPIYLRTVGSEILKENLGYVGAAMFLQQFDHGSGDYTKERREILDNQTIEDFEKDLAMLNRIKTI